MYPGLLDQPLGGPNQSAMLDGLKHPPKAMQMAADQWANPPKHVKL